MSSCRLTWSSCAIGFAAGGFFDGILLHQILQWHHLLSGVGDAAFSDIRVQIIADGLFHGLMYVVGATGVWLLWRSRAALVEPGADMRQMANALVGFGAWHILDGIFSHWITGIHRVRMDTANPLFWDLLWFFVFGVLPLLAGFVMRNKPGRGSRGSLAGLLLAVLTAGGAVWASVPPPGSSLVVVYFKEGVGVSGAFAAAEAVDGRVVWSDGPLWALDVPEWKSAMSLYSHGALLVSSTIMPAGCLTWSRRA